MVGLELRAAGAGLGLRVHWSSGLSSRAGLHTRTCLVRDPGLGMRKRGWARVVVAGRPRATPWGKGLLRTLVLWGLHNAGPRGDMRPVLDYSIGSRKVRDLTN